MELIPQTICISKETISYRYRGWCWWSRSYRQKPDGCIVWNAHNTVLGEEALLIYIVPVCYAT